MKVLNIVSRKTEIMSAVQKFYEKLSTETDRKTETSNASFLKRGIGGNSGNQS